VRSAAVEWREAGRACHRSAVQEGPDVADKQIVVLKQRPWPESV